MIIGRPYYESEKSKNMNNELKINVGEQQGKDKKIKNTVT